MPAACHELFWTDTHCHLDAAEFAADRDAVQAAARAAGVREIWVPAVAVDNFAAVRDCCLRHAGCRAAYGIHPLYTPAAGPDDLQTLADWLCREQPLAVGEIGLEGAVPGLDWARQLHFFTAQLELARDAGLPVLLHGRQAMDAVLQAVRRVFGPKARPGAFHGIAHAFNGSLQQAEQFIAAGFRLGFGGTLTYPGSRRIRELACRLPLSALVLETDAPDIPPCWLRAPDAPSLRNTPAELPRIAACLAALRGIALPDLQQALAEFAPLC